jgi:hypothetical protein
MSDYSDIYEIRQSTLTDKVVRLARLFETYKDSLPYGFAKEMETQLDIIFKDHPHLGERYVKIY